MRALPFKSLLVFLALTSLRITHASTNGLALTPPMGYNSWYLNGDNISESFIKRIADTMATNGLREAGYEYICLDDGWAYQRDTNGVMMPQPAKFPSGMKALADYVHAKGFKFGIYSVWGPLTCANLPGSCGHVVQDANTYAAWGVDYLKYDACGTCTFSTLRPEAELMANALLNCGRPIVFNLSLSEPVADWMPATVNCWRGTGDDYCSFDNVLYHLDVVARTPALAGPGHWNDPDVLQTGRSCFSTDESRAQLGMWCIVAAPLLLLDCNFDPACMRMLTNREVIAVNQDPIGIQGVCVATNGVLQVWCKPLGSNGTVKAMALLNRGPTAANITANWSDLGITAGPAAVRDLWAQAYAGDFTNSYTAAVPAHGVQLVKIVSGVRVPLPPPGTNYLSDLPWLSGTTNTAPIQLDRDAAANPLRLHGTAYPKGLGVQPYSRIEYWLGGAASRFRSDLGVDDDVCCSFGSVIFRVWADGAKLYDSGVVTSATPTQSIDLDLAGRNSLALEVTDAGDGVVNDHADWAGARIAVPAMPPAVPAMLGAATTSTQIAFSWYASPGANSYNLKRSLTRGGSYQIIASPDTPGSVDTNVVPDAVYYYVVSAVNTSGESADSAPLTVSLPAYWARTATTTAQNWNESVNWTNSSTFPNGVGRAAVVNADLPLDQTINLNQGVMVGSLTLGDVNGSAAYTIAANGGALTFDNGSSPARLTQLATSRGDTLSAPITLTNGLIVSNYSSAPLTLSGTNAISGTVTVAQGTLKAGSASALGTNAGTATIARGAALDLNGFNLASVPVTVSGAVVNTAGNKPGSLRAVTLSGDAIFGGTAPWDIRSAGLLTPAALSTGGNPYNLTKVGANQVSLVSVTVDPALGDIDIQEGTISFAGATTSMGNPTNQLTVGRGATLSLRNISNAWNKVMVLNGDGLAPTITNSNGSNMIAGPLTLNGDCVFAVTGPPLMLSGPIGGTGSLTKTFDGPLWLSGTNLYTGNTVVAAGTLAIVNAGSIAGSVQIDVAPGALLDAGGHNGGGLVLASGQTLSGSGYVNGNCTVGSGAALAQSDPTGTLTFSNSLTLAAGSRSVLGISKSPPTNVPVRVSGNLAYGGQLILANPGTNPPVLGDSFQLFSAAGYTGGFASILPRIPGPGLLWDAVDLARNGTLRVAAGNLPRIGAPVLAGNHLFISGTGGTLGTAGHTCYLLTSTNPALPLAEWTCIATNQLDGSGNFSFNYPVVAALRSSFYCVQLP